MPAANTIKNSERHQYGNGLGSIDWRGAGEETGSGFQVGWEAGTEDSGRAFDKHTLLIESLSLVVLNKFYAQGKHSFSGARWQNFC